MFFVPPSGVVPNRWWYVVGLCHLSVVSLGWLTTVRKNIIPIKKNHIQVAFVKTTRIQCAWFAIKKARVASLVPSRERYGTHKFIDLWYSYTSIFTKTKWIKVALVSSTLFGALFHLFGQCNILFFFDICFCQLEFQTHQAENKTSPLVNILLVVDSQRFTTVRRCR